MSEMIILKRREAYFMFWVQSRSVDLLGFGPVVREHIPAGVDSEAMIVGGEKRERSCSPTIPFKVLSPATQDLLLCPIFQMFYLC